jgi:hypothetical protein
MGEQVQKRIWIWLGWFVFLFVIDFWVPFSVLTGVPKMTGSFLFWIIWICVAIVSMFMIFLRWREVEILSDNNGGPV